MSMRNKNPKACEPCRRRKVRCDGRMPCSHCRSEPLACSYRLKARNRAPSRPLRDTARSDPGPTSATVSSQIRHRQRDLEPVQEPIQEHSPSDSPSAAAVETSTQEPSPQLYESVAVTHRAPQLTDSSQLFYGPSSTFAFIQQVYRIIRAKGSLNVSLDDNRDADHDEAGLDVFKQRNVFFGVPLRADPLARPLDGSHGLSVLVAKPLAASLLAKFQACSYFFFPFSTSSALDSLLGEAYDARTPLTPLKKSYLLLILAIGALQSTSHAKLADQMFIEAKREATAYEDAVTIPAIQLSLLMADYQINMGRPSSAYLHVGSACRKGMALGLAHVTAGHAYEQTQERSATLWSLYYHEIWLAMMAGRRSMIREEDVGWPYPDGHRLLADLCCAGAIMEDISASLYNQRTDTLGSLYDKAQVLHRRLKQWGQSLGIGTLSSSRTQSPDKLMTTLTLHNVYFHLVHTIFRPFLIAESALQHSGHNKQTGELWLRQACRHATDAAVDSIVFMESMLQKIDFSKIRRQDSFFIEASCIVLLFDSLRHPSKHADNLLYINMALTCLRAMIQDDPVTSVALSIARILNAVQDAIAGNDATMRNSANESFQCHYQTHLPNPIPDTSSSTTYNAAGLSVSDGQQAPQEQESFAHDFLPPHAETHPVPMPHTTSLFDLLTVDLSSYFPLDMESDEVS